MNVGEAFKSAFGFMTKPPQQSAQLQSVQATTERVVSAANDLAQKQDILGNLVKQVKGPPRSAKRAQP